jgi:hypothetical protein
VPSTPEGWRLTEAHRTAQIRLGAGVADDVRRAWPLLSLGDLDRSFPAYAEALVPSIQARREASQALGGLYYESLRASEGVSGSFALQVAADLATDRLLTSLRVTGPVAAKRSIAKGANPAQALAAGQSATIRAASRHVLDGGRTAILKTMLLDDKAQGWQRVTDGRPCAFCAMLVSRGAVYKREATGDFLSHDGCGCQAVPFWERKPEQTAQAEEFRRLYDAVAKGYAAPVARARFRRAYEQAYPPATSTQARTVEALLPERPTALTGDEAWNALPAPTLTAAEEAALLEYTGGGYESMNLYLRDREAWAAASWGPRAEKMTPNWVDGLDSAMKKNETPADVVVWRGVKDDTGLGARLTVGQELTDPAYLSTSTSEAIARARVADVGDRILYEIEVPRGTHALKVDQELEKELLLARDSRLVVTSVRAERLPDGTTTWRVSASLKPAAPRTALDDALDSAEARIRAVEAKIRALPDGAPVPLELLEENAAAYRAADQIRAAKEIEAELNAVAPAITERVEALPRFTPRAASAGEDSDEWRAAYADRKAANAELSALYKEHPLDWQILEPKDLITQPGGREFMRERLRIRGAIEKAEERMTAAAVSPVDDALRATNPRFGSDPAFGVNCVHVVNAYELRRRGFDVIATPLPRDLLGQGGRSAVEALGRWRDPLGRVRTMESVVPSPGALEEAVRDWPDGARGWVQVQLSHGGAHIFSVERVGSRVRWIDAQDGTEISLSALLPRVKPGGLHIARTDDLIPSDEVLEFVEAAS